ncbi:hypothetical protein KQI65_07065 [bacterium]|nr:hypothetical protein [bacterium]
MKRLIIAVVAGLLCLIPVTTLAQQLTFIQGSNYTRSIRGKDVSGWPPSWNPITDPSPQGDGSYLVGDWESGNDKYIDVMAMQWDFPLSLSQGAFVDSVRLTLLYGTSQSLKLSVTFFHADYEIWQHDRDDLQRQ